MSAIELCHVTAFFSDFLDNEHQNFMRPRHHIYKWDNPGQSLSISLKFGVLNLVYIGPVAILRQMLNLYQNISKPNH